MLMVRGRRGRGAGPDELLTSSRGYSARCCGKGGGSDDERANDSKGRVIGQCCNSRVACSAAQAKAKANAQPQTLTHPQPQGACVIKQCILPPRTPHSHAHALLSVLLFLPLRTLLLITLIALSTCSPSTHHSPHGRPRRDLPPSDTDPIPEQLPTATASFSGEDLSQLRRYIDHLRRKQVCDIPSVSLAVVQEGRKVASEAVGLADIGKDVKASQHTHYCLASLSKAFTAALLARLLDRKKLTLDVKVKDILKGEFPFMEEYVSNHVTVRDLLLHRTGIPRYDFLWISGAENPNAIFKRLRCMKHEQEFRTQPLYNNILYALAGHVAEVIGGATWETLVKQELLNPLGMASTTFIRDIRSGPFNTSRARQYRWNQTNFDIGDPLHRGASDISPAIGVYSTAHDMVLWLQFHLSGGRNKEGHQIIPKHVMDDMHKGQVSAAAIMRPEVQMDDGSLVLSYNMYGLAWYEGYHRGHRVLMHFGSYPGFYSMITLVPELQFGIFTSINGGMINLPYTINSHIHTRAVDLALDIPQEMWVNISQVCQQSHSQLPFDCSTKKHLYSIPGRHLRKYTGTYANPAYGNVTLVIEDGGMLMLYNSLRFDAFPLNDEDFCIVPKAQEQKYVLFPRNISFGVNATGIIEHINLSFLEFDDIFYKLSPDVLYEDWVETVCGTPTQMPPCGRIAELPQIRSAAAILKNMEVCCLLLLLFTHIV